VADLAYYYATVISAAVIVTVVLTAVTTNLRQRQRQRRLPPPVYFPARLVWADDYVREPWKKAERLLLSHLSDVQRRDYERRQRFGVIGSNGGCYVIGCTSTSGNVIQVHPAGGIIRSAPSRPGMCLVTSCCAYPDPAAEGMLPGPDVWLTQMFGLQSNEDEFVRIAHKTTRAMPVDQLAFEKA
jgi:hypothetical protein